MNRTKKTWRNRGAWRGVQSMFYWENGEKKLIMDEKKGTQRDYELLNKGDKINGKRVVKHISTRYKAPEEFSQWKSAEEVFDIQQFMQEIM